MTTVTTTVTTTTVITFGAALGLMLTLTLIALLVMKEVASAGNSTRAIRWGRVLNIGILPLLVSLVCIMGVKIAGAG